MNNHPAGKTRRFVLGVGVLGGAAALLIGGVFAAFTGTVSTGTQSISSGNVDVTLTNPTATVFTENISNMIPGDSYTRFVTVNNAGTTAWATSTIKATNTGGVLATDPNGVKIEIKSCPTAYDTSTGVCAAGEVVVNAAGAPSTLTTAKSLAVTAPGSGLYLKVTTSLPAAATNTVANQTTSLTYTVDVTQRAAVTTVQ